MRKAVATFILFLFFSCCLIVHPAFAYESSTSEIFNTIDIDPGQPVESLTVGQLVDIVELELSEEPARLPEGFYTERELMELLKDVTFPGSSPNTFAEKRVLCIEKDVYSPPFESPLTRKAELPAFKRKKVCYEQPVQ